MADLRLAKAFYTLGESTRELGHTFNEISKVVPLTGRRARPWTPEQTPEQIRERLRFQNPHKEVSKVLGWFFKEIDLSMPLSRKIRCYNTSLVESQNAK
jgi:hypothetical protein